MPTSRTNPGVKMTSLTVEARRDRILVVDDELINRKVLEGLLKAHGLDCVSAESGPTALQLLDKSIDLVLLDIMMPGMDGFAVARAIREVPEFADLPIVMVTALSAKEDRLKAVQAGANDFVAKPIDATELGVRMASLLRMKKYHSEVKEYQLHLEQMVTEKTSALRSALADLERARQATVQAHMETIHKLSAAAEYKDEDTASHIMRMSRYCAVIAKGHGLDEEQVDLILNSSPMHDIGKMGIPDAILLKPGKLTEDEWLVMRRHTLIGASILRGGSSKYLDAGAEIALSHHEKWDGTGYPNGLSGHEIPLSGRICALADVFDALTTRRPYKQALSNERSLEIMAAGRGQHFDPDLYDVFIANYDLVLEIQRSYQEE
ncbi:HD domain-containing phosphohydrolase [Humidesulfovibrio sp.]|uniref:HD domain-containing phosphohydrolase n=1 Tax=Humidesulfovibrio sp. TaxID=2910988 RepID=UPI0035269BE6